MMDNLRDSVAERINSQDDDSFVRGLAERLSGPDGAEAIAELRRAVAASNDPTMSALLLELEAMTNMTPARRVMGQVTMLPDERYPSPEISREAMSLIKTALAKTRHIGDPAIVWTGLLDHYKWHRKKKFLTASIAHCKWFKGWLLDQGRDDDAAVFRQLAIDLTGLKEKEKARRRAREGPAGPRNEIVGGAVLTVAKSRTGRRAHRIDPLAAVRTQIREMKEVQTSQLDICRRLGDLPRPPNAAWKTLSWEAAYLDPDHRPAVKSWISRIK